MKFKFAMTVELTRLEHPSEIEAKIEGAPLGVMGRLTALFPRVSIWHCLLTVPRSSPWKAWTTKELLALCKKHSSRPERFNADTVRPALF
jgi:hypothetical protein